MTTETLERHDAEQLERELTFPFEGSVENPFEEPVGIDPELFGQIVLEEVREIGRREGELETEDRVLVAFEQVRDSIHGCLSEFAVWVGDLHMKVDELTARVCRIGVDPEAEADREAEMRELLELSAQRASLHDAQVEVATALEVVIGLDDTLDTGAGCHWIGPQTLGSIERAYWSIRELAELIRAETNLVEANISQLDVQL
jgi:hypothetical protein